MTKYVIYDRQHAGVGMLITHCGFSGVLMYFLTMTAVQT